MFLNYLRVAFDLDRYPRTSSVTSLGKYKEIAKHILMHAHHLCISEQYKGIFISSDMIKSEREQHKVICQELQQIWEKQILSFERSMIVRSPLSPPPLGNGMSDMQTHQHT